jgi:hypothetical protein
MRRIVPYRFALFAVINLAFVVLVATLCAVNDTPDPRAFYLILLFALCSHIVIDLDGLNGRYALLAWFMMIYFVSFGAADFSRLLFGTISPGESFGGASSTLLDAAEAAILAGGVMLVLGYRAAVMVTGEAGRRGESKEWPIGTIFFMGLGLWAVGTVATYRWNVYIIPDTTDEAFRRGLSSRSPITITLYLIGQMCQPLGILLLAYAWSVFRKLYLFVLVAAVVVLQMLIGFVIDVKGTAMFGIIAVTATTVLVTGRLPKVWIAVGLIFVTLAYPYFTAYRSAVHGAGITRTSVVENFGEILRKTAEAKDRVNSGRERAQTFLERSNVKGSVEAVLAKVGSVVPYQSGYTLSPILQTFVPKLFWADKQRIPTGQLFNNQLHLVEGDEVYISPSHLGELYWNFGWTGVLVGMGVIGSLCGYVGARFNLADARTVTRILVTVITIRQLIVAFESTISDCYVVWLRSLAAIGLMHVVFARIPLLPRLVPSSNAAPGRTQTGRPGNQRLFPNLLT